MKDVQAPGNQEILRRADEELSLRGYSPKTRKVYRGHIERFLHFYRKDPLGSGEGEVRQYLLHLLEEKYVS
ncbi:MAG: phage integrase N-terminal SAM-like domain-containing protein [Spirochaetota bacterium]